MLATETLEGRRLEIHEEFSALLDFIWKAPRLIEDERKREGEKLQTYFPDEDDLNTRSRNAELRALRGYLEGQKLDLHFPTYMARSNLFMAASAFEFHLFGICEDVQQRSSRRFNQTKGQGVSRLFRFLNEAGHDVGSVALYEQIDAMLTIRNALFHAFGKLEVSREADKIVGIVDSLKHVEPSRRSQGLFIDEDGRPEIAILDSQLQVANYLAFRAAAYFRSFLLELSERIQRIGVIL